VRTHADPTAKPILRDDENSQTLKHYDNRDSIRLSTI